MRYGEKFSEDKVSNREAGEVGLGVKRSHTDQSSCYKSFLARVWGRGGEVQSGNLGILQRFHFLFLLCLF